MAFFDPHEQRLCVRVVYDGAAGAGKTTNMHQLASLFATRSPNRVETSYELEGRTLFFDWLQIRAGLVSGIPILCQIVSVPGQVALTPRRRHLLATADVIVYVCDSRPMDIHRAKDGLAIVRALAAERGERVPIVLQANQQDRPGALEGVEVAAALGLSDTTRIDAIASEGLGVVDTFVAAVRDLSRDMRERAGCLEVRRAPTRASLLEEIAALAIDREAAAELFLEEAAASLTARRLPGTRAASSPAPSRPDSARAPRGAVLLPTPDVPAGFIWPAHTGRDALRRISEHGKLPRTALRREDGHFEVRTDGYVLRAHGRERFDGSDAARQALVRAARERAQLEHLTLPDAVLVASESGDGGYYVWSLVPEVEPLIDSLRGASDAGAVRRWLEAYGAALVEVVRARARFGVELSVRLADFGFSGERLRYLGEIARASSSFQAPKWSLASALAEIEQEGYDPSGVRAAFEREARRRLSPDELGWALRGDSLDPPVGQEGSIVPARARSNLEQAEDR